jgi:hypothetical protein
MAIQDQAHDNFKLFTGKLDDAGHIKPIAAEIEKWVADKKVAPKSIGIEFLEKRQVVILSIGYREDEPGYNVRITSQKIGRIGELDAGERERLERAMNAAATNSRDVICHELYVTERDDLYIVTMSHGAS